MKKAFAKKNSFVLVVEERKKLIGYSLGVVYDFQNPKKIGHIDEFFITKAYRGKGFSSKLMKEVLNHFRLKGIKYVSLEVFGKNENVINIYKKFGFEPFSVHMKKKIN